MYCNRNLVEVAFEFESSCFDESIIFGIMLRGGKRDAFRAHEKANRTEVDIGVSVGGGKTANEFWRTGCTERSPDQDKNQRDGCNEYQSEAFLSGGHGRRCGNDTRKAVCSFKFPVSRRIKIKTIA